MKKKMVSVPKRPGTIFVMRSGKEEIYIYMASLMENLMDVLEEEGGYYDALLELSMKKTEVIVSNDIPALQQITEQEQLLVDQVNDVDKRRMGIMEDMANVMNRDVGTLTIPVLIKALDARAQEQRRLSEASDKLKETVKAMAQINEQNRELLQSALEMVEFDLNLVRGLKAAPQTAEYNKGAMNAGNYMAPSRGGFDAKQ